MRKPKEIIDEMVEAQFHFECVVAVVRFQDRAEVFAIPSENPLARLEELMKAGAEPIGFAAFERTGERRGNICSRLLEEYVQDDSASTILNAVVANFAQLVEQAGASVTRWQTDPGLN